MNKNFFALLLASLATVFLAGCVSTLDGRMKAGLPLKDTIEGRYHRPVDEIFMAAKEVLDFNGTLYREDRISNTLEAKIDNRTVLVAVDEVEPTVSRVRVQARTGFGADVDMASEIEKQIALRLLR